MGEKWQLSKMLLFGGFLAWITLSFGYDLVRECHCRDGKEDCTNIAGTCTSGCEENWTGMDCKIPWGTSLRLSQSNERKLSGLSSFENYCYYYNRLERALFHSAKRICRLMGMDLLSIHSQEEQRFIQNLTQHGSSGTNVWLGLLRNAKGTFQWENGSPINFSNWAFSEPNNWNEVESCAELSLNSGSWNDIICRQEYKGYICKSKLTDCKNFTLNCNGNVCVNNNTELLRNKLCSESASRCAINCSDFEFKCNNECIDGSALWRCDGKYDCFNGTDEDGCVLCKNGNWFHLSERCNGVNNCQDGTDEKDCPCSNGNNIYKCSKACHCKNPQEICDRVLGTCQSGCNDDWTGFDCQISISSSYLRLTGTSDYVSIAKYGEHCYLANLMNWTSYYEAKRMCRLAGMEVLSLLSMDEQMFILNLTKKAVDKFRSVWLALRRDVEGGFQWEDGSSMDFISWRTGQPDNSTNEACVESFLNGDGWNDVSCNVINKERIGYVCKTVKDCKELDIRCHNGFCIAYDIDYNGNNIKNRASCERSRNNIEFLCNNECIDASASWRCDGRNNCMNNTDEDNCESTICGLGRFLCTNGLCIQRSSLCDGFNDCNDGADENQCGRPKISKGINKLEDTYGAYINIPLRIAFEVEGSPNAQITSVVVISEDRKRTNLQVNQHWRQTTLKSTFENSKYKTNITLEIHNVTAEIIDCEYLLTVSNANGFATFSFFLRKLGIPSDIEGTLPLKYIYIDALKNSTIALKIEVKGYPAPYLSDITGVDDKGDMHSLLSEWTYTVEETYHQNFTTTFTLQSQYNRSDVVYQKYFAIIKNSLGTTIIPFQLIFQAESNDAHESPLKTSGIALGVVIFVFCALAVVYKIYGQPLHNFLMRSKPVTKQYIGLEPVVHFNNATPEDGSEIYDEIAEKAEALDEETNENHPPPLPLDYLHPVFVSSSALDEETNENHPPPLPLDYLHPVFVFSAALDEETSEDQPNNDELAESENCQNV